MPLDPKPSRKPNGAVTHLPVVVLAVMAAGAVAFPIALAVSAIAGIIAG
jgi:hypothetical protein